MNTKQIKFTADQRKKTFTIWLKYEDGSSEWYKTLPMDKDEFKENLENSSRDWEYFLRSQPGSYYKI